MDKRGTLAATVAVSGAITSLGVAIDRRRTPLVPATLLAAAAGAAYAVATLDPRSRLFGRPITSTADPVTFGLTFDDGPDPRHTPAISRLLARRGHRATFFVLARAVEANPDLVRQLLDDGHTIANHGDDHRLLAFASPAELRRQLDACDDAVAAACGRPVSRLFRPPHGVRSPWLAHVAAGLGYRICAWGGSVFDTAAPGVDRIVSRVAPLVRPGSIVLLHDGDGAGRGGSREQTVAALPRILDLADQAGLRSVGLDPDQNRK
jgi:peptidoglycan/xylan/chitin deacetylase (PgdA/CDA1 family)